MKIEHRFPNLGILVKIFVTRDARPDVRGGEGIVSTGGGVDVLPRSYRVVRGEGNDPKTAFLFY